MNFIPRCISKIHHNIMPLYGRGSYIIDNKGKTFLDMTSGIGALSLGHNHPSVNTYVKKQIDDIVHQWSPVRWQSVWPLRARAQYGAAHAP